MPDRKLTILDPFLGARYAASVSAVAPRIEAALGSEVMANRVLAASTSSELRLEPWRGARRRFHIAARRHATRASVMLLADVRDCYPSIRSGVVGAALRRLGCPCDEIDDVLRILEAIHRTGVPGLPIGPDPSAVLANAVLGRVDRALSSAGVPHLRWVDDVWAFASSRLDGERALESLRRSVEAAGLRVAEEKTALLEDPRAIDAVVRRVRVSSAAGTPSYHRRSDAHALPGVRDPHAVASAIGRVDPGGWTPRPAGRNG